MNKETVAKLLGDFYWDYGTYFFIETSEGNFIWSNPSYQGTGNLHPTKGTLDHFLETRNLPYVRAKGKHFIGNYCGDFNFKETE